jgi:diaminohydroxyphosphoribosylaminopyrimidine deaminase/5-amino-6-(5-phosphoribosylamino)uracil reductase
VIVKDGQVIAKGYHKKAGTPHAEIHALRAAGSAASGATMYVTLEPCNHTGKTPPCSHAVAAAGIARVVVGMADPNPLVDGTGITYLRERNIEVVAGVLEDECRALNRPFLKHITTGLPWIVMKAGISLDGKLNYRQGESGWITGTQSVEMVHRLRNTHDAIMVGQQTVAIDNPSLTTRLVRGKGRDPVRIILDSALELPPNARPFTVQSTAPTWVFCAETVQGERVRKLESIGVRVFPVASDAHGLLLRQVFRCIGENGVTSVLVEGGATLHGAILRERLYDYANLFLAPVFAGEGGVSLLSGYFATSRQDAVSLQAPAYTKAGADVMISGCLHYPPR